MHDHQHNKIIYDDDEVAESEYRNNQRILFVLSWKIRRTGDVAAVDIIDMEMLAVCPYDKGINILWVMVSSHGIMGSLVPNNLISCRPCNYSSYDGPITNSIGTTQSWPIGGQVAAASDQ